MPDLPTGTVTFLFTDIEGSTRLLQELGARYEAVNADHLRLMREAIAAENGTEIRTEGDAVFAVFPSAPSAARAAAAAQRALAAHPWSHGQPLRVRMGMHTGEGRLGGDDYLGIDVNRAARIAAAGHGGQVVISDATAGLVEGSLPGGVAVRDLGQHRLKDFDRPQRLHDLVIDGLDSDHPPLRTLDPPSNLPLELTSFVGREVEVAQVSDLLEAGRLVTLTGPGGSGKTRLAIRAAHQARARFADGAYFVALAAVTEPHVVPAVIASALGAREEGRRPVMEVLAIELRDRELLVVLDNFEQIQEASPVVAELLAVAPGIRILVTSRGPLHLQGERVLPVPPLDVPGPGAPPERSPAVTLFAERAAAVDPAFALDEETAPVVAEICRRLDGLPLAIELAASRLRLLSPGAMLERLDRALPLLSSGPRDAPDRQRTLRGAIAWSYELLSPEAATLFRRLSVFAGGFTLDAAEAVCGSGVDVLEGIEALLDAGLLRRPAPDRFDTLRTIAEFGIEQLEAGGEASDIRHRHALRFLDMAEESGPGLRTADIERHLGILDTEHDNLRAALAWCLDQDEGEVGLRLVWALWRFWQLHGDLSSGRLWTEQVLALPSAAARTPARGHALSGMGSLAYWQRDQPAMLATYHEALDIFRETGDRPGEALATFNLAFGLSLGGEFERALELLTSTRGMFEELGDRRGMGDALFGLAIMHRLLGRPEAARENAAEALRTHEELGDSFGVHGDLYVLGRAAAELGDLDTAQEQFLKTLAIAENLRYLSGIALSLDELADTEFERGRPVRGLRLAAAAQAIKESVGGEAPPELLTLLDPRERARTVLAEEELEAAWRDGQGLSAEEAVAYARAGRTEDPGNAGGVSAEG